MAGPGVETPGYYPGVAAATPIGYAQLQLVTIGYTATPAGYEITETYY